jgi:Oligonucleotide/oligosaccharide-binding (OB)-fold
MLMRTLNVCGYAKKRQPTPCEPSVQTYAPPYYLPHTFPLQLTVTQNYISATTIRDITILRNDLLSALTSAGLVPVGQRASSPELNVHSSEPALLKALLLAALYPRVARIALPRHAVKFARLASGTVARDVGAHEWRATDMRGGQRVWVHPASVLFTETGWRSGIVVSFERVETTTMTTAGTGKVYLRDVTEVRLFLIIDNTFLFIYFRSRYMLSYSLVGTSPWTTCVEA